MDDFQWKVVIEFIDSYLDIQGCLLREGEGGGLSGYLFPPPLHFIL